MALPGELVVMIMVHAENLRTLRRVCRIWTQLVDQHILSKYKIKFPLFPRVSVLQWLHQTYGLTAVDARGNNNYAFRWAAGHGFSFESWELSDLQIRSSRCVAVAA